MIYVVGIIIIFVIFNFLKGGSSASKQVDTLSSNVMQDARLALRIPKELPINWASSHSGIMHVGSAAIVNCERIMCITYEGNATKKWEILLENITRYKVIDNQNNKWSNVYFYLNDGSQESIYMKQSEVPLFLKEYQSAVQSNKEMQEFINNGQ